MIKKKYYIPTTDIIAVQTTEMMAFDLAGSNSHEQANSAPVRRDPVF